MTNIFTDWWNKTYHADKVTFFIRISLYIAITLSLGYIVFALFTEGVSAETLARHGQQFQNIFFATLTLALTFAFDYLERKKMLRLPRVMVMSLVVFIYASLFLGEAAGFYGRFWWWDDMLHTLSGLVFGIVGFLLVYALNAQYEMKISPLLIAVFSLTFAISIGVAWEIFEFTADMTLGTNMQKWDVDPNTPLLGNSYQGYALRDTMSDLIVDTIGGIVAAGVSYYLYSKDKRRVLRVMRRTFGDDRKTKRRARKSA